MILIQHNRILGDIYEHIARLETLVVDLERYTSGERPTQAELQAAPLLSPYQLSSRPAFCLSGVNNGHPVLNDRVIHTSELHVIAPIQGWARTYSRLYRLGEPFDSAVQDMLLRGDRK